MKILQINSVSGIGSTGRIVLDIHGALLENGQQSIVAYGRGEAGGCSASIKIGNKFDNYVHGAKTRVFDKHGLGSRRATRKFIEKIIGTNPDLIHLHNIHGYYINIKFLFNFLVEYGKPVVWTLHDCWSFTGHCAHFDYIGCERWKVQCHNCPQKREYPSSILFDNSSQNFELKKGLFNKVKKLTIVTPSSWLESLVKNSFLKESRTKVINNGIDLEAFKPTDSGFREKHGLLDTFIILGVANVWGERKGLEHFIELSRILDENCKIVLVGLTGRQIRSLPRNMVGIEKTTSTVELAEIYSAADIYVNPTLEDTFPTTNIESLACGTPVVTFNTGGSPESVPEDFGVVTTEKTAKGILQGIAEVQTSGKLKDRTAMLAFVRGTFSNYLMCGKYLDLYNETLN
ncbi:MAG: glycosyltransferase [Saccharofermentanales bacterium]